jgi:hypothetical protein
VVSGSSEGDKGGILRWLNDGGMTAQWWQQAEEEEKGLLMGGGVYAPFIDGEGESGAAARLWAARWRRQSHGHGKVVVAVVRMQSAWGGAVVWIVRLTSGAHVVLQISRII